MDNAGKRTHLAEGFPKVHSNFAFRRTTPTDARCCHRKDIVASMWIRDSGMEAGVDICSSKSVSEATKSMPERWLESSDREASLSRLAGDARLSAHPDERPAVLGVCVDGRLRERGINRFPHSFGAGTPGVVGCDCSNFVDDGCFESRLLGPEKDPFRPRNGIPIVDSGVDPRNSAGAVPSNARHGAETAAASNGTRLNSSTTDGCSTASTCSSSHHLPLIYCAESNDSLRPSCGKVDMI